MVQQPRRDNKALLTADGILAGPPPYQNAFYCDSRHWYFEGPVHGAGPWFDATSLAYGAVGDGVADDTDGIQAALDAAMNTPNRSGTVYLPAPSVYYKITRTLRLYRADFAQVHVNIVCAGGGVNGIVLQWLGGTSSSDVGLYIINNIGFKIENLLLAYSTVVGGPAGSNYGMVLSNSSGGTGTQNGLFLNCGTIGFPVGTQIGSGPIANGAASEIKFINHVASYCNQAVEVVQQNTLDIYFDNLQISANTIGGDFRNSQVFVNGGSASANTNDFKCWAGGTVTIQGFRSESSPGQFLASCGGAEVTLLGNLFVGQTDLTKAITADGGKLTMFGNNFSGYVYQTGSGCHLTMHNNRVAPGFTGVSVDLPFEMDSSLSTNAGNAMVDCLNNTNYSNARPLDDVDGIVGRANFGAQSAQATVELRAYRRMVRDRYKLWAQNMRGITGLSGTIEQAKNLRGSATFNSSGTVTVTLGQAEIHTLSVVGGTPTAGSGILENQLLANAAGNLTYNATASDVSTILSGATPPFAATASVTGGPLPGTPIVITYSANGPQFLPYVRLSNLNNSSSFSIVRTQEGTVAEIDANYKIIVTGNANETYWVTSKAAGSFVINSSNASSTATVDWMLIR